MQLGYLFAGVVLIGLIGVQAQAADITLAKDGKSDYTIVLSKDASPSEKHAARELQRFIREMSGAELPIANEGDKSLKKLIVLGDSSLVKWLKVPIDFKSLGDEGFAIKTTGPHLIIAGGRLRGTMYGVYTFLEDLGCRWYSSKVSRIPKMRTITVKPLDIVRKPAFEYREPYYRDAFDADWAARNKSNGNSTLLDEQRGGKVIYGRFCHTFDEIAPTDKYFKDHPEYYSLVNGKRVGGQYQGQLCLTNPDVLKIATEKVFQWIRENPKATIFSVTQNDNSNYCQCDACKAVDAEEGSPSGLMLRFVNAIADEVTKKYPDKLIDTFAYQYTEKPPKITSPRPNVRVRMCPIFACEMHDYEKCPNNASIVENLRNWSKITDNLYIWHYNTDFGHYLMPFPDLDQLATSIPLYKRNGVVGMFNQGNYSAGGGGWMDELKAYYIAKLLWNPKTDARAVREDFLNGYFGRAGKPIGQWLDILHEKVRKDNIHAGIYQDIYAPYLVGDVLTEGERLFDEAEKLADNPDVLERVKHARLSLTYVGLMRDALASAANGTPDKAETLKRLEAFIAECKADGITNLDEGRSIDQTFEAYAVGLRK